MRSLGFDPKAMQKIQSEMGKIDFKEIELFIKKLPLLTEAIDRVDKTFMLNAVSNESLEETIKKVYLLPKELEVLPPK